MKIGFSPNALNAFQTIKRLDPDKAERIKNILKDAMQHPEFGIGDPVALEGKYKGLWQRKISFNEFLYYIFNNDESVYVVAIKVENEVATVDKESSFELGAFSEDELRLAAIRAALIEGEESGIVEDFNPENFLQKLNADYESEV